MFISQLLRCYMAKALFLHGIRQCHWELLIPRSCWVVRVHLVPIGNGDNFEAELWVVVVPHKHYLRDNRAMTILLILISSGSGCRPAALACLSQPVMDSHLTDNLGHLSSSQGKSVMGSMNQKRLLGTFLHHQWCGQKGYAQYGL